MKIPRFRLEQYKQLFLNTAQKFYAAIEFSLAVLDIGLAEEPRKCYFWKQSLFLLKYVTNLQPFARLAKHGLKHYAGANNNSK